MRSIVPRRDHEIDRANVDHTLNFLLDEQFCRGDVNLACSVFDLIDVTQISTKFTDTLHFVDVSDLRLQIGAVEYTGQGLNLPPPKLTEFQPNLWFTESTYPIARIIRYP